MIAFSLRMQLMKTGVVYVQRVIDDCRVECSWRTGMATLPDS